MSQKGVRTLLKLRIPSAALKNEYANRYLDKLADRVKNGVMSNGTLCELSSEAKKILLPGWNTPTPPDFVTQKIFIL